MSAWRRRRRRRWACSAPRAGCCSATTAAATSWPTTRRPASRSGTPGLGTNTTQRPADLPARRPAIRRRRRRRSALRVHAAPVALACDAARASGCSRLWPLLACSGPPAARAGRGARAPCRAALRHQRALRRPERDRSRPRTGSWPPFRLGKRPRGIRVSPDGCAAVRRAQRLAVRAAGRGREDAASARPLGRRHRRRRRARRCRLLKRDPGGHGPGAARGQRDGRRLFVANEDAATASVVDAAGRARRGDRERGGRAGRRRAPAGRRRRLRDVRGRRRGVRDRRREADGARASSRSDPRPRSTAFLPDGSRAYVTCENGALGRRGRRPDATRVLQTIKLDRRERRGRWARWRRRTAASSTSRPAAGKTVVVIDTATDKPVGVDRGRRAAVGHRDLRGRQDALHRQRPVERRLHRRRRQRRGDRAGRWATVPGASRSFPSRPPVRPAPPGA